MMVITIAIRSIPDLDKLERSATAKVLRVNNQNFTHSSVNGEGGGNFLGWVGSIAGKSDSDGVKVSVKYTYMKTLFYEDLILSHAEYLSLLSDTNLKDTSIIELIVIPVSAVVRDSRVVHGEVYLKLSNRLLFVSKGTDPLATFMYSHSR